MAGAFDEGALDVGRRGVGRPLERDLQTGQGADVAGRDPRRACGRARALGVVAEPQPVARPGHRRQKQRARRQHEERDPHGRRSSHCAYEILAKRLRTVGPMTRQRPQPIPAMRTGRIRTEKIIAGRRAAVPEVVQTDPEQEAGPGKSSDQREGQG